MSMDPEVKRVWQEALRSGEYEQGRGQLRDEDKFCCLGVLLEVSWHGDWEWADDYLPTEAGVAFDVPYGDQEGLANMNDGGRTFDEIADWIEANL